MEKGCESSSEYYSGCEAAFIPSTVVLNRNEPAKQQPFGGRSLQKEDDPTSCINKSASSAATASAFRNKHSVVLLQNHHHQYDDIGAEDLDSAFAQQLHPSAGGSASSTATNSTTGGFSSSFGSLFRETKDHLVNLFGGFTQQVIFLQKTR